MYSRHRMKSQREGATAELLILHILSILLEFDLGETRF